MKRRMSRFHLILLFVHCSFFYQLQRSRMKCTNTCQCKTSLIKCILFLLNGLWMHWTHRIQSILGNNKIHHIEKVITCSLLVSEYLSDNSVTTTMEEEDTYIELLLYRYPIIQIGNVILLFLDFQNTFSADNPCDISPYSSVNCTCSSLQDCSSFQLQVW